MKVLAIASAAALLAMFKSENPDFAFGIGYKGPTKNAWAIHWVGVQSDVQDPVLDAYGLPYFVCLVHTRARVGSLFIDLHWDFLRALYLHPKFFE